MAMKKRKRKKWTKEKSKIKKERKWTQRKSKQKRKKKDKNKRIDVTSRKETYGEERKIKNNKGVLSFHKNHKIPHTCTS